MFLQTQLFGFFTHLFPIQLLTFLRAFVFFVFATVFFTCTFFATIRCRLYPPSLPAGLLNYILCPYRALVDEF